MSERKRGLGRGLSSLMADAKIPPAGGDADPRAAPEAERQVPIERIQPNPDQPRRDFDQTALNELAASVGERGVIQPLIVRPKDDGYEIVAGERRWRAAQKARLHKIPVIVRELTDTEVLELAIIENIQRADLNPIEEAAGYRQLMDRFGHTQEQVAKGLGKSRSHIANLLRLLTLPDGVQKYVRDGRISAGHARALVTSDNPEVLAAKVVEDDLTVREVEKLTKSPRSKVPPKREPAAPGKDADTRMIEDQLAANLGLKVRIAHSDGSEKGELRISYETLDQLDDIIGLLNSRPVGDIG